MSRDIVTFARLQLVAAVENWQMCSTSAKQLLFRLRTMRLYVPSGSKAVDRERISRIRQGMDNHGVEGCVENDMKIELTDEEAHTVIMNMEEAIRSWTEGQKDLIGHARHERLVAQLKSQVEKSEPLKTKLEALVYGR